MFSVGAFFGSAGAGGFTVFDTSFAVLVQDVLLAQQSALGRPRAPAWQAWAASAAAPQESWLLSHCLLLCNPDSAHLWMWTTATACP